MNIKELMNWRHDCFFCHEELTIVPELDGVTNIKFWIEGSLLVIKSEFVNGSIHIETGEVYDLDEDKITIDNFISNSRLRIAFKCLNCLDSGKLYQYYGLMSFISIPVKHTNIFFFNEIVSFNHLILHQNQQQDVYESLISFQKNSEKGTQRKFRLEDFVKVGFIDLKKTTPEKLEHKLKTYIVFS